MKSLPEILTERLRLRAFILGDAPTVQRLAGERRIADVTANIPHPYKDGMAEAWIHMHAPGFAAGTQATFAITLRDTGELIGAIGLVLDHKNSSGELGYWIGLPFWRQGYCTEAARAVVHFGFHALNLHRIQASHLTRNPASGRVMQKIGMIHEGHRNEACRKWDRFEDIELYGLLSTQALSENASCK